MLKGFEATTAPLSEYEMKVLVPLIVRGLRTKVGKAKAVTNSYIVRCLKGRYELTEARVRKIINYIRCNDIVPFLIATSTGYYIATSPDEVRDYEESLLSREAAIRAVREAIHRQLINSTK